MKIKQAYTLVFLALISLSLPIMANTANVSSESSAINELSSESLLTDENILTELAAALAVPLHDPQLDYPGSPEKALTENLILELISLNDSNQIYSAWHVLAKQNDGYAKSATRIFGNKITVERCVVESNWKLVVGRKVKNEKYFLYAKQFQRHYIDYLQTNRRYPNSLEIEKMYQQTDDEFELPQSVSVDLMMNLVPTDWKFRVFFDNFSSLIKIGQNETPKLWYHYTKLSSARTVSQFITANDITTEQAKKNYKNMAKKVASCMAKKIKSKSDPQPQLPTEELSHD